MIRIEDLTHNQLIMIKQVRMCDNCFSRNIKYNIGYRTCKDCGATLNIENILRSE